MQCFRNIFSV